MALRKKHTAKFKTTVALEALKGIKTAGAIASDHGVHPGMVSQWKTAALEILKEGFTDNRTKAKKEVEDGFQRDQLLAQIGQLKVELDWLKKRL